MRIGYACLTIGVRSSNFKSCTQKNATNENLTELITYNLGVLDKIIEYNISQGISMFRITSDLIPFGSSPINSLPWHDIFASQFQKIGEKIKKSRMRVSMHPGQYTVLNSKDEDVVYRAVKDLEYHEKILAAMGLDNQHKIILHIGGVYQDKEEAMKRFCRQYEALSDEIKGRLIIENDDKSYTIADVLSIGELMGIPVVFDNLHNRVLPSDEPHTEAEWMKRCKETWTEKDGNQKIHYSQQAAGKRAGSHSDTILASEFLDFYGHITDLNPDIMLEVKDKNLSAIKCNNLIRKNCEMKYLEKEWSRYKYSVLERSPSDYKKIRILLQDKTKYPARAFYELIEHAFLTAENKGYLVNGAQHVWGYFRGKASEKESERFHKMIEEASGFSDFEKIKKYLWKLTEKYQQPYLMESLYFFLGY